MVLIQKVRLTPKGEIDIMIEAEMISPDSFAGKSEADLCEIAVWQGPRKVPLAEFFEVEAWDEEKTGEVDGAAEITIDGDVSRVKRIGQRMTKGRIEILGSAGMHLGSEMAGGEIRVKGKVGPWAGMNMRGGRLEVGGDAGDHAGSAYRGSWRGMSGGGSDGHQLGNGSLELAQAARLQTPEAGGKVKSAI